MRMRFEVMRVDPFTDGLLLVQLAGEYGNNFHLYMPGNEEARLRVGQEFILSDIDGGPSLFSSTDLPLGGRKISIED
jgi:hypothetical protein